MAKAKVIDGEAVEVGVSGVTDDAIEQEMARRAAVESGAVVESTPSERALVPAKAKAVKKVERTQLADNLWAEGLNRRQRAFCLHFVTTFNATQSAIAAGYSPKTAYALGSRLLKKVEVARAVERMMAEHSITRVKVLQELAAHAFTPMTALFHQDANGVVKFKAAEEMTEMERAALTRIRIDPETGKIIDAAVGGKMAALVKLLRALGADSTKGVKADMKQSIIVNITPAEAQVL